jgi:glutathione S-transferase
LSRHRDQGASHSVKDQFGTNKIPALHLENGSTNPSKLLIERLLAAEGKGESLFDSDAIVETLDKVFGAKTENLRHLVASAGLESLSGLSLRNANLRGQDLSGLDFTGVDLSGKPH